MQKRRQLRENLPWIVDLIEKKIKDHTSHG